MSARDWLTDVVLFVAVGAALISAIGLLVARDVFDRLHFVGAAATVPPLLLAAAVLLHGFSTAAGTIQCVVALVLVAVLSPVATVTTGRMVRQTVVGNLRPAASEMDDSS